ncbi:MAG: hypothetical protein AB1772_07320 [Candidatus Zixiibacteriota bacterium]
MKKAMILLTTLAVGLGFTLGVVAEVRAAAPKHGNPPPSGAPGGDGDDPARTPAPVTIDMIVHDQGNIVTTVDNYGLIGSHHYYGYPSGEWPRNSGHDYLAEINYWMGTVTVDGDTLVADTYEDFQAIPSLITGQAQNRILLSTDSTRYFDFDPADTVGAGGGNPARGWRVWSGDSAAWVYPLNYNPTTSSFFSGGPLSVQESHYRFGDHALGTSLLGLEMTHTVLQWNYCYNEDFMFVILEITNTSTEDYNNFAFGLYCDMDVGGFDGTGENGRLGDLVGSDSTENLAWIYDEDGYDPGWGRNVEAGFMGTKYLETPGGGGMTAFRTGDWALLPDDDPGRYALINSTQYDGSLPPTDQYYVQCTRGITLAAGATVRVVYALVAGQDEAELRDNAQLAQELYDNYFVGPEPPNTPALTVQAGDEKVYLRWNDTAQHTIDPLSGENDFAGYKLYRSDDRGRTWGDPIYNTGNDCLDLDYKPIAKYQVNNPDDPIQRSIIDTGLINGVEYWYCLVAYDTGASATGVDVLQTGFGVPGSSPNIVSVSPRTDPAGYYEAAGTVRHVYSGTEEPSEGSVVPVVFDRSQTSGDDYQVVFEDTPERTYWHLINVTTGDTVLVSQTLENADPGMYEVAEGLRVVVRNADPVPRSMGQTALGGADTNLVVTSNNFFGTTTEFFLGENFGSEPHRATYELRFSVDSTVASAINDDVGMGMAWSIPFEAWNVSANQRVALVIYDIGLDGAYDPWDPLIIVNTPYDPVTDPFTTAWPYDFSWMFRFSYTLYNPSIGDVYTIQGAPMNSPEDVFEFSSDAVNSSNARGQLARVKVVPDPYYAYASLWEVGAGESNLQFQNLPDRCTIRIYTLSGELVKTLEHTNGSGTEEWNLQSVDQRLVVSGVYIYHIESRYGERLGRFAVVK